MKVIQINSTANSGSTGKITEGIGKVLLKNKFESKIVYGRRANKSTSKLIKVGNRYSQIFHLLITRAFDLHGFGSYISTYFLLRKIIKEKPDLIHLHNIHGYYINFPLLFKFLKKHSIPTIWTLHDCWSFTGHCSHYVSVSCEKWKTSCNNCPLIKEYPKAYFDNSKNNFKVKRSYFTSLKNLTFVTPSKWLGNQLSFSFLKSYPQHVINNGIDLNVFKPNSDNSERLDPKFIVLGVASVWTEQKGLGDFKKLAKLLDNTFQIILIGLTENQIKQLPSNIIGITRTESMQELANYYSKADVFFNPTYEDTFPTTNIESLACGTPVITYNTGGSPEILDEDTGYVVEKGDLQTVINLLSKLESKNEKPVTACRKRAEMLYNENLCFENYISLYKKILYD